MRALLRPRENGSRLCELGDKNVHLNHFCMIIGLWLVSSAHYEWIEIYDETENASPTPSADSIFILFFSAAIAVRATAINFTWAAATASVQKITLSQGLRLSGRAVLNPSGRHVVEWPDADDK